MRYKRTRSEICICGSIFTANNRYSFCFSFFHKLHTSLFNIIDYCNNSDYCKAMLIIMKKITFSTITSNKSDLYLKPIKSLMCFFSNLCNSLCVNSVKIVTLVIVIKWFVFSSIYTFCWAGILSLKMSKPLFLQYDTTNILSIFCRSLDFFFLLIPCKNKMPLETWIPGALLCKLSYPCTKFYVYF